MIIGDREQLDEYERGMQMMDEKRFTQRHPNISAAEKYETVAGVLLAPGMPQNI